MLAGVLGGLRGAFASASTRQGGLCFGRAPSKQGSDQALLQGTEAATKELMATVPLRLLHLIDWESAFNSILERAFPHNTP